MVIRLKKKSILVVLSIFLTILVIALAFPAGTIGASDVVNFLDPNLEQAVRDKLEKPSGDITKNDMLGLYELGAGNKGIVDLSGLENAINLEWLDLGMNYIISDISPLSGLTNLEYLNLWKNQISNISPLSGLTNLRRLELHQNNISDISPLGGLTNLEYLDLYYNHYISDISPLSGLTNLRRLSLEENNISDISPLSGLTNLEMLYLRWNQISDISPLVTNSNAGGLGSGDYVYLCYNFLDLSEGSKAMQDIEILINNGVVVDVPADSQGPITSNVVANPNPAAVNSSITVTANIDDSGTGGSNIASAEYSLDGIVWIPLNATDGAFDEVNEDVTGSFTATTPGVYELWVRGKDAADIIGMQLNTMLAVYDPKGGFVTGGGWIYSPAGNYIDDLSLAGKATFDFDSKYLKGATVPTGKIKFNFKVAGLNFHSSSYDWLVVNQGGKNAQLKGTGTINGKGTYHFMLWAGDGKPDTFRIKIWTENGTENIVYDNGADQPIGGGNIVVHKK